MVHPRWKPRYIYRQRSHDQFISHGHLRRPIALHDHVHRLFIGRIGPLRGVHAVKPDRIVPRGRRRIAPIADLRGLPVGAVDLQDGRCPGGQSRQRHLQAPRDHLVAHRGRRRLIAEDLHRLVARLIGRRPLLHRIGHDLILPGLQRRQRTALGKIRRRSPRPHELHIVIHPRGKPLHRYLQRAWVRQVLHRDLCELLALDEHLQIRGLIDHPTVFHIHGAHVVYPRFQILDHPAFVDIPELAVATQFDLRRHSGGKPLHGDLHRPGHRHIVNGRRRALTALHIYRLLTRRRLITRRGAHVFRHHLIASGRQVLPHRWLLSVGREAVGPTHGNRRLPIPGQPIDRHLQLSAFWSLATKPGLPLQTRPFGVVARHRHRAPILVHRAIATLRLKLHRRRIPSRHLQGGRRGT